MQSLHLLNQSTQQMQNNQPQFNNGMIGSNLNSMQQVMAQLNFLTQQLAEKQKQIDDLKKSNENQIVDQSNKMFTKKPNLK